MTFPVFDLHCDTAYALLGNNFSQRIDLHHNSGHIDLQRATLLPKYAQCFACFTSPADPDAEDKDLQLLFQMQYEHLCDQLKQNEDIIRLAKSAEDIKANSELGLMSAILTIEGPAGFCYNADALDALFDKGFRITTLGWNESNCLAGSCVTGGGLTDRGAEYVMKAQQLGMLIDVSHLSDEAFWDVISMTQRPIIASHSNSRAVCSVKRNLTDDMFRAICQTGGLAGINLYTEFLGDSVTLDTVCDHILHFLELDPSGKHIALGGDLDGCESLPSGFTGIQSYCKLGDYMLSRGLSQDIIYNIFWNNALGVIAQCCT